MSEATDDRSWDTLSSEERFRGYVFRVTTDEVRLPGGDVVHRDVVRHPGAVGVVALDDQGRVMLIEQYRHPVGRTLLELPAGLLDKAGEPASDTAARELAEEVSLAAGRWDILVDAVTSSGMTDEAIRIYLARDITEAPDTGFVREHEEADLRPRWVPLEEAVLKVQSGEIVNALCIMGILAADRAARDGYSELRPAAADWPDRPEHSG